MFEIYVFIEQYRKVGVKWKEFQEPPLRQTWDDYPSTWSVEKVKEHERKYRDEIPAERAQYSHRGVYYFNLFMLNQ